MPSYITRRRRRTPLTAERLETRALLAVAPGTITEYPIPVALNGKLPMPIDVALGPDGSPWVTESAGDQIARFDPIAHTFTGYGVPTVSAEPYSISPGAANDPSLYFTENGGGKLGRITTEGADIGQITEAPVTDANGKRIANSPLVDLAYDPQAGLFFTTQSNAQQVAEFYAGSDFAYIPFLPGEHRPTASAPGSGNFGVAVDKYSATAVVYFTESAAGKIGVYEYNSVKKQFVTKEYSLPAGSQPMSIVQGPDGAFWFTEFGTNEIGRIDPTTHVITQYAVPTPNSQPWGITASATTIYLSESAGNKIGRITFTNGKPNPITEIALPDGGTPLGITAGSHGQVWFAEETGNRLGLYDDTTVPTFTVTSAADSGTGTLRAAIKMADMPANAGSTIAFNIPGGGVQKISLQSELPAITEPTTINGYTQPGASVNQNGPTAGTDAVLLVEITTAVPSKATNGLDIAAGGGDSVIEGLAINGFTSGAGIKIEGGAGTAVQGDWIGVTANGDKTTGNMLGVEITAAASKTTIGGIIPGDRNLISGNVQPGIYVHGTSGNIIVNNLIGTDQSGTGSIANQRGIVLDSGASFNTIGSSSLLGLNVTSGNSLNGVELEGGSNNDTIQGNYIGTSATGLSADPNQGCGVVVASSNNTNVFDNVISGNSGKPGSYGGLLIGFGPNSSSNTLVAGNDIGVGYDGATLIPNAAAGIEIDPSAGATTIGGTQPYDRNIIAGNGGDGIVVNAKSDAAHPINILGNWIGAYQTGMPKDGNAGYGVEVASGIVNIGGTATGAGNVISGNTESGIYITTKVGSATTVEGNLIGLDSTGTSAIPNVIDGVLLQGSTGGNTIGGSARGAGNVISGNSEHGVELSASPKVTVANNIIGLNKNGDKAVSNQGNGVQVENSNGVLISGNLISGNAQLASGGIHIAGSSSGTRVTGNAIGLNEAGTQAVPNVNGVVVESTTKNTTIGGTAKGARNIISGNAGAGVLLKGTATVVGNFIGTDDEGKKPIANASDGIQVMSGGSTIAGNVISGNTQAGIDIASTSGSPTNVEGNLIGVDPTGRLAIPNADGVDVKSGIVNIGGTATGAGNVISGNKGFGVHITAPAGSTTTVQGNLIGLDSKGTFAIPNAQNGVYLDGSQGANMIGGTATGATNVISGNKGYGVDLVNSPNVIVASNIIGLNQDGTAAVGNGIHGVVIDSCRQTTVSGNVISGNENGIEILGSSSGTQVTGNTIGLNKAGTQAVPNAYGVVLEATTTDTTIGGTAKGARNIISGNTGDGVLLKGPAKVLGNFIGTGKYAKHAIANGGDGIESRSGGSTIAGNVISGNTGTGIAIMQGSDGNQINGNYVGTNGTGTSPVPNAVGVLVAGAKNTLTNNVVSGNTGDGIIITGNSNTVGAGLVGVAANGLTALPNERDGVQVAGGMNNVIGVPFTKSGANLVVSGNADAGVLVDNASSTLIQGCYIGVDKNNTTALPNAGGGVIVGANAVATSIGSTAKGTGNLIAGNSDVDGVQVASNAGGTLLEGNAIGEGKSNGIGVELFGTPTNTTIGGTAKGAGNIIAGNSSYGIHLSGTPSGTLILGNDIGVDANGDANGNGQEGILIDGGSKTTIGGPGGNISASRNVISGNEGNGITVTGGTGLLILGNLIGTNPDGKSARPNGGAGVEVDKGATATIGMADAKNPSNEISGNKGPGILLNGATAVSIVNNAIGLTHDPTAPARNGADGIQLLDSTNTAIGGAASGAGNFIGANQGNGIQVGGTNSGSSGTLIEGNLIGLDGSGHKQPNTQNGIDVTGTASNTTIGSTSSGAKNIISGNELNGITIDVRTTGNLIEGNLIGLNLPGLKPQALGNGQDGVHVLGPSVTIESNFIEHNADNGVYLGKSATASIVSYNPGIDNNGADGILIQGTNTAGVALNTIGGNKQAGVSVQNGASAVTILGNFIGTNADGNKKLPNETGVEIDGSSMVQVGGVTSVFANLISGNRGDGMRLKNDTQITILGNLIGTGMDGNSILGNGNDGINITGNTSGTTIGDTGGLFNVISGNGNAGVELGAQATGLTVLGNFIGTDKGGSIKLPNKIGVLLYGKNFQIGGPNLAKAPMQGNVISGNTTYGIELSATAGTQEIFGNDIGTTPSGSTTVGNLSDGVYIVKVKASGVMVGSLGNGNLISGNGGSGVAVVQSQNISVSGNYIGTNPAGDAKIANGMDGVRFDQSSNSTAENNLISGNQSGVVLINASHGNTIGDNTIGTDPGLTMNLGNAEFGILVNGNSNQNTIGGNVIAFNAKGVVIGSSPADNSSQDSILGNSIFNNSALGIDLGNAAPKLSASTKGPNNLQHFPVLSTAVLTGGNVTISGDLSSSANHKYRVEFFIQDIAGTTRYGQGKKFIGFVDVTTDKNGRASIQGTFAVAMSAGQGITATATDLGPVTGPPSGTEGDTSEFCKGVVVS